ncbi:MAG: zinc ribbon domain-containing protein [Candidatus Caldarchaeum sp.]
MSRKCSACRLSLPADAVYCHECGRRVEEGKRRKLLFSLVLALALTVTTAAYVQWTAATSSTESWAKELRAAGFNAVADSLYVVVDTRGLDVADFDRLLTFLKKAVRMALVRDVSYGLEPARAEVVAKAVRSIAGVEDVVYDGRRLIIYVSEPTAYQLYRVFSATQNVNVTVIILTEKI